MEASLDPVLRPMLARLVRTVPRDGYFYEPKWDGFRCLAFRDGDAVDLRSRNQKPLARYFPDVVDALLALPESRFVLDGELLATREGRFDFEALMARLHPSPSSVELLRRQTPASFVVSDTLERTAKRYSIVPSRNAATCSRVCSPTADRRSSSLRSPTTTHLHATGSTRGTGPASTV